MQEGEFMCSGGLVCKAGYPLPHGFRKVMILIRLSSTITKKLFILKGLGTF